MPARNSITGAKANPIGKWIKNKEVLLTHRVNLSHGENKVWKNISAKLVEAGTRQAKQNLPDVLQAPSEIQDA